MSEQSFWRLRRSSLVLSVVILTWAMAEPAAAVPSFLSDDSRLPNPDRPYVMEGGVTFGNPFYVLSELQLTATNPEQLDTPMLNLEGDWEFDSTFAVAFDAVLSIGLAPPLSFSGTGTVHAVGVAPGDVPILAPLVYNTEIVSMSLQDGFYGIRESPTLESSGITTVENLCLACAGGITLLRISSFFDVFAELSLDGGTTWIPADASFRIFQTPEPATAGLLVAGAALVALRRARNPAAR